MCSRASSRWPVDASIQAASRSARRPGRAPGPRRRRRRARPGCAARRGCRRGRSTPSRTRWRCASARSGSCVGAPGQRGVDVGALGAGEGEVLGLAARCARPASTTPAASANHAACAARRALGQPGLRHRLERERADAVEQPVADGARRRRRSPASGSRAARPRRSPPTPARRARRGPTPPPRAARRRRTWPAPTGRAGRRGTAGRSSTRSSPSAPGGARACGWPGRSAR